MASPVFATITQSPFKSPSALARVNNLTQSILAKAFRVELTAQWLAENPELISGDNSAAALLEKIKAERAASTGKKATSKNPYSYFFAHLTGAHLIISCQLNINIYIQMIL